MGGSSLSQVLLTDDYWRNRLIAYVPDAPFGVEWASGRGSLTELLTECWDYLISLEIDAGFCGELRNRFPSNQIGVVRADAREYPLPERETRYPLVGNLPYHLTGPLLVKIARCAPRLSGFYGLVQEEVAHRIVANPGDAQYRSISLLMQWCFETRLEEVVPASAFSPQPEVNSGWVTLMPRNRERSFEAVRQFAETCFRQPRKTLLNNLAESTGEKSTWSDWFHRREWDPRRRPHSLTRDEFLEVFDEWNRRLS